jgi:hypothetical protein
VGLSVLCAGAPVRAADPATAAEISELKERIRTLEEKQAESASAPSGGLPDWVKSIELHGFVSAAYTWNFNEPPKASGAAENGLRIFDFKHNAFRLDTAQISLLRRVKNRGDAGFRIDLDVGSNIPQVIHSSGLFDDDCVAANPGPFAAVPCGDSIDLRQAFASYIAPVGNGLQLDIGKFVTHLGLEVIEGWESMNDNYSRSIGFGFAIPFTHTGIRTSYAINDQWSLMAMVANGWDRVDDNNEGKAFGGQVAFKPVQDVAFYLNYIGSPEQDNEDDHWRHLAEFVWVTKPLPSFLPNFTFSGSYDIGYEENVPTPLNIPPAPVLESEHSSWQDAEVILKYDWSSKFATALRGEWFYDHDGARTGVANQRVWAVTFTPTYKVTDNFAVRPELRWDHARKDTFLGDDDGVTEVHNDQITAAVNAVFSF